MTRSQRCTSANESRYTERRCGLNDPAHHSYSRDPGMVLEQDTCHGHDRAQSTEFPSPLMTAMCFKCSCCSGTRMHTCTRTYIPFVCRYYQTTQAAKFRIVSWICTRPQRAGNLGPRGEGYEGIYKVLMQNQSPKSIPERVSTFYCAVLSIHTFSSFFYRNVFK